jgi:hypothetical protein
MRTGKASWTVAYAVTSMEAGRAGAARIGALVRWHWNIEAWHHVKDVSLGEDACKVRSGHGPNNLAALRALAVAAAAPPGWFQACRLPPSPVTEPSITSPSRSSRPGGCRWSRR